VRQSQQERDGGAKVRSFHVLHLSERKLLPAQALDDLQGLVFVASLSLGGEMRQGIFADRHSMLGLGNPWPGDRGCFEGRCAVA
jgi:hypothetical protein